MNFNYQVPFDFPPMPKTFKDRLASIPVIKIVDTVLLVYVAYLVDDADLLETAIEGIFS